VRRAYGGQQHRTSTTRDDDHHQHGRDTVVNNSITEPGSTQLGATADLREHERVDLDHEISNALIVG